MPRNFSLLCGVWVLVSWEAQAQSQPASAEPAEPYYHNGHYHSGPGEPEPEGDHEHHEDNEPVRSGSLSLRGDAPLVGSGWFGGSFQDSAQTLRGVEREFARVDLAKSRSFRVAGRLPVEVSGAAGLRARDRFGVIGGDPLDRSLGVQGFALAGDALSASAQAAIRPTARLSILPRAKVERAAFGSGILGDGVSDQLSNGQAGVDLVYQAGSRLQLKLGVGRGAAQLQPNGATSAALAPSQAQSIDIGGAYTGKYAFFGVNTFHRQLSDVIESVDGGEGRARSFSNTGDGFTSGMETEQRLSLGFLGENLAGVSLWSNQTLLISRVDDGSGVERSIQGVPLFLGNAGLRYQNKQGTSASATATYVGERLGALGADPSQMTFDIAVRQRVSEQASVFLSLENLTNEQQALSDFDLRSGVAGRDQLTGGRTFFTGLSWQLGAPPAPAQKPASAPAP